MEFGVAHLNKNINDHLRERDLMVEIDHPEVGRPYPRRHAVDYEAIASTRAERRANQRSRYRSDTHKLAGLFALANSGTSRRGGNQLIAICGALLRMFPVSTMNREHQNRHN
jgi:hypothetical protein